MVTQDQLLLGQGAYYALSGLWPLAHLRSFLAVTGPKRDLWLVKTVGLLIAVVGVSLLAAALRGGMPGPETVVLAAGCAAVLAAIDVFYSIRGEISTVYLADAAAEGFLLWLWATKAAGM